MAEGKLEAVDFNKYLKLSERATQAAAIACNDAFVQAMTKAVKRGREKVTAGTYVDLTPPIGAVRIYAEPAMSACGSPSAMCLESGGAQSGAAAMK
jgi:hypothetical protein